MALKPKGIMSNFKSSYYQHFIGPPNTDLPDSLNSPAYASVKHVKAVCCSLLSLNLGHI